MSIVISIIALLATLSGVGGYYADNLVRDLVRSQLSGAERLEVRVEAIPNYKLISGEIDRLRLAGRGLYVRPDLRIARLDVETDGILIDLGSTPKLRRPLQAAINLELTETDLNRALNAPDILKSLQGLKAELPGGVGGSGQPEVLNFTEPHIALVGENQVIVQSVVRVEGKEKTLLVTFRSGLAVDRGTRLRLVNPVFTLDDVPVPPEIADVFLSGLNQVVDFEQLAKQGIDARILKLEVEPGQLNFVGFARIEKIPGAIR
jgi:hypothetical protein